VNDTLYRSDFPSIDTYTLGFSGGGIFPSDGVYANLVTLEVVTPFSFTFNVIGYLDVSGSLTLPTIGDVEDAIQGKEPTIQDNGLSITQTAALQDALDDKYNDTGGTIDGDVDITGNLVVGTTNIISEIDTKQDEITTSTDLSCNSLNTNQLIVNDDLYFDTIVIRRPTGATYNGTDFILGLRELQCWVNDTNILINGDIIRYFAEFTNNGVDVGALGPVTRINDNDIPSSTGGARALSSTEFNNENISLICKEIPRTKIQDIQSIAVYNRAVFDRAIGLAIELYNIDNDPNLETPLASTNEITSGVEVYRFDFPAIDTYPSGDFSDTNSITQIASETLALKEVVSEFSESANITGGLKVDTITTTGNVDITGDLTCNSITSNNLTINDSLSVDTRKYFDTIVLRRPTDITGEAGDFNVALRELQVWIGGSYLLQSSGLESLFVNWAVDKEAILGSLGGGSIYNTSKLYDNVISNEYDAHSKEDNSTSDIALIIKGLPLTLIETLIETIQALVLYNRTGVFNNTTIGLAIELYNSTQDPTLTEILATTSVITTAVDVYRFDFPDIATYTGFATGESLTNIIREEDATSEVVSVSESPTEMEGGLMVDTITTTGLLMVEEVNVKDTLS